LSGGKDAALAEMRKILKGDSVHSRLRSMCNLIAIPKT
jgi:hypothetical protein